MRTMTATAFRANLFRTLKSVAAGGRVRITSKWGNAVLLHESGAHGARGCGKADKRRSPEMPGLIIGSLDDADEALRNYIRMPS